MSKSIDKLVLEYRASTNSKERNRLFKEIAAPYLPRVEALMTTFSRRYRDDILSTYYWFVLRAIEKWKNDGALFLTYLYPYTGIKLKSEIMEKYVNKDRRMISLDDWDE